METFEIGPAEMMIGGERRRGRRRGEGRGGGAPMPRNAGLYACLAAGGKRKNAHAKVGNFKFGFSGEFLIRYPPKKTKKNYNPPKILPSYLLKDQSALTYI